MGSGNLGGGCLSCLAQQEGKTWLKRPSSQGHWVPSEGLAFSYLAFSFSRLVLEMSLRPLCLQLPQIHLFREGIMFPAVTPPGHQVWYHKRIPLLVQRRAVVMRWPCHLGAGENGTSVL